MAPWNARPNASFVGIIRAVYTGAELDRARLLEAAMLPRTDTRSGRHDVRQTQCGATILACPVCAAGVRPCPRHHCPGREVGTVACRAIVRPGGAVEPQQRPPAA